jgi:hypothetical protein
MCKKHICCYDAPMLHTPDQSALLETLRQLLQPLARLAVSRGLPYARLDEMLRSALVDAARQLPSHADGHGEVSRISTATGLNRREVTRLLQEDGPARPVRRWPAGEVFTRWLSDAQYRSKGRPRTLARQGAEPSFESLAQSVTRDIHPRSLLEELTRLGLARWDEASDTVELQREAVVPRSDFARMLSFLGDNVGDHLNAAVENVLGDGQAHFEQAIYADELSDASLQKLRALIAAQWTVLFESLVPALEGLIAEDQAAGRPQDQRARIGFYSFTQAMDKPGN